MSRALGRGVRLARPRMTEPVIPTKAGYVVTRSRPYLARRCREVVAVSGKRLGAAERQIADGSESRPTQDEMTWGIPGVAGGCKRSNLEAWHRRYPCFAHILTWLRL